jgi:hypothetical protein
MTTLTRNDVVTALGPIDDLVVAEILSTHATAEELAEARAWIGNDEPLINSGRPLPHGRVGRLVQILDRLEAEEPGPAGHRM